MKSKYDNTTLGIVLGVVAPLITFLLILKFVYPFEFADKNLHGMFMYVLAPRIISLGAIPNLGVFFLFVQTNKLRTARGVLGATILYGLLILIIKLFF